MAAASFHQERPFELVFAEAHARMTASPAEGGPEGYMVTVLETAGVTHNVFDWDGNQYRHYTLSIDPTVPLDRETGSMQRTVYYAPSQVDAFRRAMMLATRSALQSQTIQYYRADREPQLRNTGFPLANITYPHALPPFALPAGMRRSPLPLVAPPPTAPLVPLVPASETKRRHRYRYVVLALLIVALLAACYYR